MNRKRPSTTFETPLLRDKINVSDLLIPVCHGFLGSALAGDEGMVGAPAGTTERRGFLTNL